MVAPFDVTGRDETGVCVECGVEVGLLHLDGCSFNQINNQQFPRLQGRIHLYLSGPMTGLLDHNYPAFNAAAAKLRAAGFVVSNPAENDEAATWADYMRKDIAQLVACDWIALLPGWEESKGAKLEHHIATSLGMPVLALPGDFITI